MTRPVIRMARMLYRATPVPAVRRLYFDAFCRVMRGRRVRATVDGLTFDLDLGEMIDVGVYLEQYEPDVKAALKRHCRPGMTVLDIGANIGAHTLAMGKLVTETGAVYAFEPTDFAYQKLAQNLTLNDAPQVHAVKAALGDVTSERQQVNYRASWRTAGGRQDGTAIVDFVRLDDWCIRNGVEAVGLIKVDIDGNEFPALSGGTRLLERCRPVLVMEAGWPHFADESRNPFSLLQSLGYSFRNARTGDEYRDVAAMARVFPDHDPEMTTSINVVATPLRFQSR
jgi:FkbM family methyltransferase